MTILSIWRFLAILAVGSVAAFAVGGPLFIFTLVAGLIIWRAWAGHKMATLPKTRFLLVLLSGALAVLAVGAIFFIPNGDHFGEAIVATIVLVCSLTVWRVWSMRQS